MKPALSATLGLSILMVASSVLAGYAWWPESPKAPEVPEAAKEAYVFQNYHWVAPLALDGHGNALSGHPLLAAPDQLPWMVQTMLPQGAQAPQLAAAKSGTVFATTWDDLQATSDLGKSWRTAKEFQSPLYPFVLDQFTTFEPTLAVDPDTGRLFLSRTYRDHSCTNLAYTDNDGQDWTEHLLQCNVPFHVDQTHVAIGPARADSLLAPLPRSYANDVLLCTHRIGFVDLGTWCSVSRDGGETFPVEGEAFPAWDSCSGGQPVAYPDGSWVMPLGADDEECQRNPTVAVTEDGGLNWDVRVASATVGQTEPDPDITITPDGTAYMVFRGMDQLTQVFRSKDKFVTWDGPFKVAAPDQVMNVLTSITSGDDGRIAVAYLATRDAQKDPEVVDPSSADGGTLWHAFLALSDDAASERPTFVTQQLTPEEDPVQVGCIWIRDPFGGQHACNNVVRFIDATRNDEGRALVAITDACTQRNGCAGDPDAGNYWSNAERQVAVFVQDRGLSLFRDKGVLPSVGLTPPYPYPR